MKIQLSAGLVAQLSNRPLTGQIIPPGTPIPSVDPLPGNPRDDTVGLFVQRGMSIEEATAMACSIAASARSYRASEKLPY